MKKLRYIFIAIVGILIFSTLLASSIRNIYGTKDGGYGRLGILVKPLKFMAEIPSTVKKVFSPAEFYVTNSTSKEGLTFNKNFELKEFGLNHKPFLLTSDFAINGQFYPKESLNYWLSIWLNYYTYIINLRNIDFLLIQFEDLIDNPTMIYRYIAENLTLDHFAISENKHSPSEYKFLDCDSILLGQCMAVYDQLTKGLKYNQL